MSKEGFSRKSFTFVLGFKRFLLFPLNLFNGFLGLVLFLFTFICICLSLFVFLFSYFEYVVLFISWNLWVLLCFGDSASKLLGSFLFFQELKWSPESHLLWNSMMGCGEGFIFLRLHIFCCFYRLFWLKIWSFLNMIYGFCCV